MMAGEFHRGGTKGRSVQVNESLSCGEHISCDSESEASVLWGKSKNKYATPETRRSGDPTKRWKVRVDCEGPEHSLNEGHRKVS